VRSNTIIAAGMLGGYSFKLAANARLTDATKMYLFRTDAPTKGLIRQQETEPTLEAIAEGSEEEKKNKRHLYMVDTWRNVGYGLWQRAVLTTFT
jgi:phage major head subunit gpT-like protein